MRKRKAKQRKKREKQKQINNIFILFFNLFYFRVFFQFNAPVYPSSDYAEEAAVDEHAEINDENIIDEAVSRPVRLL